MPPDPTEPAPPLTVPPAPPPAAQTQFIHSLRSLVRGLSALFWGLPICLLTCVQSALTDWLRPLGAIPPLVATGLLLYGTLALGRFRPAERAWQRSLESAQVFGVFNVGLSPFVFFWSRYPQELYFRQMLWALALCGVIYLFNLNRGVRQLAAQLPDRTLREDAELFTLLNFGLMLALVLLVGGYLVLQRVNELPLFLIQTLALVDLVRPFLLIFLVLLPITMTMSLLWKIKDLVLAGIFAGYR